jgi:hypothetical protein
MTGPMRFTLARRLGLFSPPLPDHTRQPPDFVLPSSPPFAVIGTTMSSDDDKKTTGERLEMVRLYIGAV